VDQDVVDLVQQLAGRRRIGDGDVHLGQLQPQPNGHDRQHVGS
jgi:hypothetical protein